MHFCSWTFVLFFTAVFLAYWATPWRRGRVWLLLGASCAFYASWSRELALLVVASAALDYGLARALEGCAGPRRRRALVAVSVTANLGLLCYFKYAGFFLRSLEEGLHALGADVALPALRVLAPLGISFYTFEAISYVVDVYRGRIRAERDLAAFLLFILFFPHLMAGPIVRAGDFLPQVARHKRWSWLRLQAGAQLFLLGLFKKLAIADRMALFADPVFADPGGYRRGAVWIAVFAYALQIYADFSGYSDMALGFAHLLGYKLAPNFRTPYLAPNIAEFWRRWHVSLSGWLRDYLFIPLGGSLGLGWQTVRNLMATMTLGGLWHGASWTFVAWGVLHGLLLVLHRAFRAGCAGRPRLERALRSGPGTAARVGCTFLCVCLGWVFFRAQTFGAAAALLARMVWPGPSRTEPLAAFGFVATVVVVLLGHGLAHRALGRRFLDRLPAPVVGACYAGALMLALLLAPGTGKPFIYFQF
jgi:alginate O-acetyltransferase complex protein AlgI